MAKCASYQAKNIAALVGDILDKTGFQPFPGSRILVKPNLLTANALACSSPQITAAVCQWLLDRQCRVSVSDSPAFGTPQRIAESIGLAEVLKPLSLKVAPFRSSRKIALEIENRPLRLNIATEALECDAIFSVARVKAHSQMRMTICVKNCFGVVPGLRKALLHGLYGKDRNFFAALLAKIWENLPPVCAVADGIVAMSKTGPIKGAPFPLGLLGASRSAALLDMAVLRALKLPPASVPLAQFLLDKNYGNPDHASWPLLKPDSFDATGFQIPETLKSTSFSPFQLARSCLKRLWKKLRA